MTFAAIGGSTAVVIAIVGASALGADFTGGSLAIDRFAGGLAQGCVTTTPSAIAAHTGRSSVRS
ncbi:MAG: hypothetical protein R3B82_25595 [Sandaracinaceae bacterium]